MSVEVMGEVWKITAGITQGQKFVLLVLADCADAVSREAWPSTQTIAERVLMSRATVCRRLAELERDGRIVRLARPGSSTMYRVGPVSLDELPQPEAPPRFEAPPVSPVRQGVPQSCEARTVREPSKNRESARARCWTRVPETERLTPEREAMAIKIGLGRERIGIEWAKYIDHEFAQPKKDVDATWRNWCRTALEMAPRTGAPVGLGKVLGNLGVGRAVPDAAKTRALLAQIGRAMPSAG